MPWDPHAEYLAGLVGCIADPEASRRFDEIIAADGQSPHGGETCARYGLAGTGAGKLWAPFNIIETVFPGALPASAQTRGDCVSHSTRNACLGTVACEIYAGLPDEATGIVEGKPEVSVEAQHDGVFASEAPYWFRGRDSDGWSCEAAAQVTLKQSGVWVRKNYDSIGVDLTRYNGKTAGKWGSQSPPEAVLAIGRQHLVRTATRAESFDEVRDLLANGYCISSCGGESWANTRNEDGVSERTRQGWSHALAVLGVDDRDEIKKKYGEPLIHIQNSWAKWNTGPRRVLGTSLEIPEGSFWSKWSDAKNRVFLAFSGVNGWPAQQLPNWTGDVL